MNKYQCFWPFQLLLLRAIRQIIWAKMAEQPQLGTHGHLQRLQSVQNVPWQRIAQLARHGRERYQLQLSENIVKQIIGNRFPIPYKSRFTLKNWYFNPIVTV